MEPKNIYFSGPDGSRKTSMAFATKFFLEGRGKQAVVISFPNEASAAYPILRLALNGRISLGAGAIDLLFAADRLDVAPRLQEMRRMYPDIVFIFDRGPADGAVYAEAIDSLRDKPIGLTTDIVDKWDSKFLEMFPVHLGVYLRSSVKTAERLMQMRKSYKPVDELDRNSVLQQQVREIFDRDMEGKPEWRTLSVDPEIGETLDNWERRVIVSVLALVSEANGHPEWLEAKDFRRDIKNIRERISEQPPLVYKENRSVLSLPVLRERDHP